VSKTKPPPGDLPTFLSQDQAERLLGVGPTFLGDLVARGDLPAFRLGTRTVRFELADVLALLKPVDPA
jgi:excisionase family DNA binding protein